MPEYLAPAVYVEEVDTGSKPIEGVSTSTAGMIGMSERGPVNVPTLVTGYGEYRAVFGDLLDPELYRNAAGERLADLPHAVSGFFTNGGKRVYVTRVLVAAKAAAASTFMFDRSAAAGAASALLSPITTAALDTAYFIDLAGMGVTTPRTWLQIGSGGELEFAKLEALPAGENDARLALPLQFNHAGSEDVARQEVADQVYDNETDLAADAAAGATSLRLASVGTIGVDQFVEIRNPAMAGYAEFHKVKSVNAAANTLELHSPLHAAHAAGRKVRRLDPATGFTDGVDVEPTMPAFAGDSVLHLTDRTNYVTANDLLLVGTGASAEVVRITNAISRLTLKVPLARAYARGTLLEVVQETAGAPTYQLERDALAGETVLKLKGRQGLNAGDVLKLRLNPADDDIEYVRIVSMPNRVAAPDAGLVMLATPLARAHPKDTEVKAVTLARAAPGLAALTVAAGTNATTLDVSSAAAGVALNTLLRLHPAGGTPTVHRVGAAPVALTPRRVTLAPALTKPHLADSAVRATAPLFEVRALDAGQWGNRLRVAVREPDQSAVDSKIRSPLAVGAPDATHIRLESANGVEVGSVLQKWDPALGFVGSPFKVIGIDRLNGFLLTLDSAQVLGAGDVIRSHEFDLQVFLLRQPDKATPSRNNEVIASETFAGLTLDPRHSRYLHRAVGATWDMQGGALVDDEGDPLRRSDRRSEGTSGLVRLRDIAMDVTPAAARDAARAAVRVGPVFDLETLPDGRRRPTRYALQLGDDALEQMTDDIYIGTDNPNPELRTGLETLRNVEEISIVGAPGRTSAKMQNALINHCELMRYRFVVLDGNPPPKDTMADIRDQRQQFDTKYAALYHPWLLIQDPYPDAAGVVPDYAIPPSGHVLGIYARTDIERGVHKAPANEVVRGVIGLQRTLNKEQHDILNPYPVNINVIRDFRPNNRGIRVYGGRCITSDSDWKYVNVRRLLIFIEASIDRGLQWVVFEPNAEPLWARVRRSISNFLTLVWRNGALEGTKVEEAYFVKCDRTTMTQTDIDQGRLICLVGVAPVKPAEFVIVRIGLWTAHADE
jgi:uncharacterized protein